MAKLTDSTFWKSPEAPTDWEGMVNYFRPRATKELHELFDIAPPTLPDPSAPPQEVERQRPTLLEQLRLTEEEFVELALAAPQLWNEEELDYLHLAAEDGTVDEHLGELVHAYFSGERHQKSKPKPTVAPILPTVDTSLDEMPDLPTSTIPDLEVLEGTQSVDRWWEKQKK